jgi:predicted XRE-type DNA-binding protein
MGSSSSLVARFGNTRVELWQAVVAALQDVATLPQADIAILLGASQPEISALKRGDLTRFSIERLLAFLRRLNYAVEIRLKRSHNAALATVRTEPATSEVLGADVLFELTPGIVIIAGHDQSGRSNFLDTVAQHHRNNGVEVSLVARKPHFGIDTNVYVNDEDFHDRVLRLPSARVVAIDDLDSCGDESGWAALHFASNTGALVYVTLRAPNAAQALGSFAALLGRAHRYAADDSFAKHVRAIVTLRRIPLTDGASAVLSELAHCAHTDGRWQAVIDRTFSESISQLGVTGAIESLPTNQACGPIRSSEQADQFLNAVAERLSTYTPRPERDDRLGLDIVNASNGRSVQIHVARNRERRTYNVFIATEEPDRFPTNSQPPETRLFGAPSDVSYVANIATGFLAGPQETV